MNKVTVKIDGMMCGMCESHINDCIRQNFKVKKVSSSHSKGETIIIMEEKIEEDKLKDVIGKTGYEVMSVSSKPYENKGVLGKRLGRKGR